MRAVRERKVCLAVGGVDPGGGAGITADLATFAAHGAWGTCAVTAVTAQTTTAVRRVVPLDAGDVLAQVDAVLDDIGADAVKTGMLATAEVAGALAERFRRIRAPLVVDPVLSATVGGALTEPPAVEVLLRELVPLAALVTPNAPEAQALTGVEVTSRASAEAAARALVGAGAAAVLVKGGHLDLGDGLAADCFLARAGRPSWIEGPRLAQPVATHGTGCVLASAVAARLAHGTPVEDAVRGAKSFVAAAMAAGCRLGRGPGAVDPWRAAPP